MEDVRKEMFRVGKQIHKIKESLMGTNSLHQGSPSPSRHQERKSSY